MPLKKRPSLVISERWASVTSLPTSFDRRSSEHRRCGTQHQAAGDHRQQGRKCEGERGISGQHHYGDAAAKQEMDACAAPIDVAAQQMGDAPVSDPGEFLPARCRQPLSDRGALAFHELDVQSAEDGVAPPHDEGAQGHQDGEHGKDQGEPHDRREVGGELAGPGCQRRTAIAGSALEQNRQQRHQQDDADPFQTCAERHEHHGHHAAPTGETRNRHGKGPAASQQVDHVPDLVRASLQSLTSDLLCLPYTCTASPGPVASGCANRVNNTLQADRCSVCGLFS
jgi:hypothetical protein